MSDSENDQEPWSEWVSLEAKRVPQLLQQTLV